MKYRLNKNTFIRKIDNLGYIMSQLTRHDRNYDDSGIVFLEALTRQPQTVNEIMEKIIPKFLNPSRKEVCDDLIEFLEDLTSENYLTKGENEEECARNELVFSYSIPNTKTTAKDFIQSLKDRYIYGDTTDLISQKSNENPRIHACQIELTNKCNERCIHCYIPHEKKNCTLDTNLIFKILDELHEMGTLNLTLSGGEALIHPDIEKILLKARELDFTIALLTNLTLLKEEQIPFLKKINLSVVQTSLYSMVPEEHDKITQLKGSQVKTFKNLERLIAADIPVQVSCPTMKTNFKSYKKVLEWAYSHKCKAQTDFIMMARTDFSKDNLDERLTIDETRELISDMLVADVDYGEYIADYKPQENINEIKKQTVCGVGVDNICLAADGTYYPCSGWQGLPVGNAKEQTLQDVWKNSPQLKMLRGIKKASFPKCLSCKDKDFCSMCLVRNFNESGGDMMKINDHFCKVARINRELVEAKLKK